MLNTDFIIGQYLLGLNEQLSKLTDSDCIFVNSGIVPPLDSEIRVVLEGIKTQSTNDHLIVMLQTGGGFMETVERIVTIMREHYHQVSFVIPDYAYSAGTVLALSGDSIYMDYHSVLGPIDPQIQSSEGQLSPGLGILAKFDELCDAINEAQTIEECRAELAYLIHQFAPEKLFAIEQAKEHGISLISEWLPKYKFKDWKKTETTGTEVTDEMRKDRAKDIAKTLGDATKWHSHGRGISMRELQ